jgi:hypothetical protein
VNDTVTTYKSDGTRTDPTITTRIANPMGVVVDAMVLLQTAR